MVIDRLPRSLRQASHDAQKQHQSGVFQRIQDGKPRVVDFGIREQILIRKQKISVKKDPEDQQKDEVQGRSIRLLVVLLQMWLHRDGCHERHQMEKQRWISN